MIFFKHFTVFPSLFVPEWIQILPWGRVQRIRETPSIWIKGLLIANMTISPNIFIWDWRRYFDFFKNTCISTTSVVCLVTGDSRRKCSMSLKVLSPPQLHPWLGLKLGSVALEGKRVLNIWVQSLGFSQSLYSLSWDSFKIMKHN